jgi:homoserine O-succinyltransferase/O-acetyltransferase
MTTLNRIKNLTTPINIAILDMYAGDPNEGMRCIHQLIDAFAETSDTHVSRKVFDVRLNNEVPDVSYDLYISTGGPGNPLESEGSPWEQKFFSLMDDLHRYNAQHSQKKKHVLLICHSFQLYCRQYGYGTISKRKSTSFGVMTVHKTAEGKTDSIFQNIDDPFWVVDSRDYQITQPDEAKIKARGGALLCIEKYRPHVKLERAAMAIRFDEAMIGMQFHPEADATGMRMYLHREDKKNLVIKRYGEKKYHRMLEHLNDPDKIMATYHTVIPQFLKAGRQVETFSP